MCEGTCSDGSHFTTVSVDGLQCANQAAAECAPGTVVAVEGFVAAGIAACCFPNGACGDISGLDCVKFGGTYQGLGSDCASASCSACPSDLDGNGEVRVPDLIKCSPTGDNAQIRSSLSAPNLLMTAASQPSTSRRAATIRRAANVSVLAIRSAAT